MNILILGSGGREHAFAWKIRQSSLCERLFVIPGNAGTAQIADNVNIQLNNFAQIAHFVIDNEIDLVVVGPEEPLVRGIKNFFAESEILKTVPIIGPDKEGAKLEGSKDFAKKFMKKNNIPTAKFHTFTADMLKEGMLYLQSHPLPIVLKADGLAAGKGVIISETLETAQKVFQEMLLKEKFGEASHKVVVEQYLKGIEVSVFVLTDGEHYKILPEAKDYKRIGEGDTGLNTGGMGAVSPVPFVDSEFMDKVEQRIIKPTIEGLKNEGIHYVGFIFIGLMNVDGDPYVIEYNARMGDPETEVVIPRIESDLLALLQATAEKKLDEFELKISTQTATTVMLVSGGYPEHYEKNKVITGIEDTENVLIFHAGTSRNPNQQLVTNGGRVLSITGLGNSVEEALEKSNLGASKISFEHKYYRKDIGQDLL